MRHFSTVLPHRKLNAHPDLHTNEAIEPTTRESVARIRACMALLFFSLLIAYAYFIPKTGRSDWAASSRADLVYAVVDQHVLTIDSYQSNTGDKAYFGGHYYSVDSIGPSLLALPSYLLFKAVVSLPPVASRIHRQSALDRSTAKDSGVADDRYHQLALVFLTAFTISIPSAILGVILFLFTRRLVSSSLIALTVALTYGLGTIAFPYSKALFQHQISALGIFLSLVIIWSIAHDHTSVRWLWVAGALMGLAAISEYPTVPVICLIALWAVFELRSIRMLLPLVIGSTPFLLLFAFYNLLTFHSIFPLAYRYHVYYASIHRQGFMGIASPSLYTLYELTLSPFRGLFFISPVLVLALPGAYFLWTRYRAQRSLCILLLVIVAYFFLYNASYLYWSGGRTVGPRFLVPLLPFMMLLVAFALDAWQRFVAARLVIGLFIAVSVLSVWTETIAGQVYPPDVYRGVTITNPLFQYSLPVLSHGDIARNYGTVLGFGGFSSLVPLLLCIITLTVVAVRGIARGEQCRT